MNRLMRKWTKLQQRRRKKIGLPKRPHRQQLTRVSRWIGEHSINHRWYHKPLKKKPQFSVGRRETEDLPPVSPAIWLQEENSMWRQQFHSPKTQTVTELKRPSKGSPCVYMGANSTCYVEPWSDLYTQY